MRRARLAAGLTANEVSAHAGIHPTGLSRIENGRRHPAEGTIQGLAALYGVTPSQLVGPDEAPGTQLGLLSPHLSAPEYLTSENSRFLNRNRMQWLARADHRENARWFAARVFEPVRAALGVPLRVVGGYRAQDTHRLILIDGTEIPGHVYGLAIDVIPVGLDLADALWKLDDAARRSGLDDLDFAIQEYGRWIHIQAPPFNRTGRKIVVLSGSH